jgi:hypothetical protein
MDDDIDIAVVVAVGGEEKALVTSEDKSWASIEREVGCRLWVCRHALTDWGGVLANDAVASNRRLQAV